MAATIKNVTLEVNKVEKDMMKTLQIGKEQFTAMLKQKISYLDVRCQVMRLKQDKYRQVYDMVQIFIIVVSSILTLWEAVRSEMDIEALVGSGSTEAKFIRCIPVILSSSIGLAAAILKFKNYRTKIDAMTSCVEQVSFVTLSAKKLIEQAIHITSLAQLDDLRDRYLENVHPLYTQVDQKIAESLKYNELVAYRKKFLDLKLQLEKDQDDFCDETKAIDDDNKCRNLLRSSVDFKADFKTDLGGEESDKDSFEEKLNIEMTPPK